MLTVQKIDTSSKAQVRRFVRIPYKLYANHPQWVPPLFIDSELQLNREKHPFYGHSVADFWVVSRDGEDVGRIAALENLRFNEYHKTRQAQFYLFESIDDQDVANLLFEQVFEWARKRGLNTVVGPKGFAPLDGYGIQIEGFEHRQMMTMMNYNYPYYQKLVEGLGFRKEVDFVSCYLGGELHLPDRVTRIADRVIARGELGVQRFATKSDLKSWAKRIGKAYNDSFINNWEYYPLLEREIQFVLDNILTVADPRLIKVITHKDDAVGFLFAFPDLSAALQRAKGHINPLSLVDLILEMRRTKWVSVNGIGILPQFKGRGGNALLYSEMGKTIQDFKFEHADLTQVAETAVEMRHDLINVGGKMYKNHRVFHKDL